jgi:hypothetical protein
MKIKTVLLIGIATLLFAGSLNAQKTATKFTSVYTNLLTRNCKVFRGKGGTDDAALCKGAGGYMVRQYYSAASMHLHAELKGHDGITLATTSVGYDDKKLVLEWRMADGKPFAVILRLPKYGDPTDQDPYFGKVIGEELVVVGLEGYEDTVKGEIDAKTPGANVKARKLADRAYRAAAVK